MLKQNYEVGAEAPVDEMRSVDGTVKYLYKVGENHFVDVYKRQVLASAKKLSQARPYCQKAIGLNENYGAPYILIANLYAMSPNWSDESALNKCCLLYTSRCV